jgi:hypothetical protein
MKVLNSMSQGKQRLLGKTSGMSTVSSRLLLLLGLMTMLGSSAMAQGDRVCLYDQPNYRGQSVCFSPGERVSELQAVRGGWNDRAQSIRIFGNAEATIFEHAGFTGASFYVDASVANLAQIRQRMRGGLQNEISSIAVERRQFGRRSDYNQAYRLGQRDYIRGRRQNYRNHTSRYDRLGEAEFRRGYNEGYVDARTGRDADLGNNRPGPVPNWPNPAPNWPNNDNWRGGAALPGGRVIHRGAIFNRASDKALDVAAGSAAAGANIQQWDYAGQPNQVFRVIDLGRGEVAIIAEHSGLAMTVTGAHNGANIVQREWRNSPFQRWRLQNIGGNYYRIVNAGSGKSLDVAGRSRFNGANVQQWNYAAQQNQEWRFSG